MQPYGRGFSTPLAEKDEARKYFASGSARKRGRMLRGSIERRKVKEQLRRQCYARS